MLLKPEDLIGKNNNNVKDVQISFVKQYLYNLKLNLFHHDKRENSAVKLKIFKFFFISC